MIRLILAILFILIAPVAQPAPACVVATADLVTSLGIAQAGPRCLDIPAGVYSVGAATSGAWLNATADNLEIRGAGEGKTILQVTTPLTLTAEFAVVRLFGIGQHVHDLTINLGSGHHGTGNLDGISIYGNGGQGSFVGRAERALIERVEVTGGYSADGSGGFGIGTYRTYDHQAGAQWNVIRDNWIHDSPATGIGVNSNNNLLLHNLIQRVGTNALSHGFYAQGGYNVYDGNTVENATGYSFHGWKKVPSLDSSGDRYVNNISLNPGAGHMIVSGLPGLGRSVVISNNIFRMTDVRGVVGLTTDAPASISENVFEDVATPSGATITVNGAGSVVSNNLLTSAQLGGNGIATASASTTTDNTISGAGYLTGISAAASGAVLRGNRMTMSRAGSSGVSVNANAVRIEDNDVTGLTCMKVYNTLQVIIRDNVLTCTGRAIDMPADSVATLDRNILR